MTIFAVSFSLKHIKHTFGYVYNASELTNVLPVPKTQHMGLCVEVRHAKAVQ